MKSIKYIFTIICIIVSIISCKDDDSFSSDPSHVLSFAKNEICLDTVFANTLSAYKTVMVYNKSGDGMRIASVQMKKGYNTTGFLVNVNGSYLNPEQNNQVSGLEVRKGDSLRVFVEFKPKAIDASTDIKEITDEIIFTYESGTQQTIKLSGKAWNANVLTDYHVTGTDEHLQNIKGVVKGRPYVIYKNLTIDENAKLTIDAGDTLYFHQAPRTDAGIDVFGTLHIEGTKDKGVLLRCDRLDSLLQLKYDNVPGKWKGIHLFSSSKTNAFSYMELHGSNDGIICDTTSLSIDHSTIHNISGVGIQSKESTLSLKNVQLSNACLNCLDIIGGAVSVNSSTIASFYAYSNGRQHAINFTDKNDEGLLTPLKMHITNSIITGYDDDEVWYTPFKSDSTATDINIDHCLLRTEQPDPNGAYASLMTNCIYENVEDTTTSGWHNFKTFDTYHFYYDFTPKEKSKAVMAADPDTSELDDRKGFIRKEDAPDMGCFETAKQ